MQLFSIVIILIILITSIDCRRKIEFPNDREKMFSLNYWYGVLARYEQLLLCPIDFCVLGYYVEWDTLLTEDLVFFPLHCSKPTEIKLKTNVFFTGGDGIFDDYYEPYLELYHNCTEYGQVLKYEVELGPVEVNSKRPHWQRDFVNIYERGTKTFSYRDATRFEKYIVTHQDMETLFNEVKTVDGAKHDDAPKFLRNAFGMKTACEIFKQATTQKELKMEATSTVPPESEADIIAVELETDATSEDDFFFFGVF